MCGFALAGKDEQRAAQPMISLAPSNSTCTSVAAADKTTSMVCITFLHLVDMDQQSSIHTRVFAATEAAGNGQGSG